MIKNIVFDIGNVLLTWNPGSVVSKIFSEHPNSTLLTQQLFKSEHWLELNRGKLTEVELIDLYHQLYQLDPKKLVILMEEVKKSLLPIENSFDLLTKLQTNYSLYALTDNVREIMIFLRKQYNFWDQFKGVVVSAEVGFLKPTPEIYRYLLEKFCLNANETLFIDDHLPNVEGARSAGLHSIQFIDVKQCLHEMKKLNIKI